MMESLYLEKLSTNVKLEHYLLVSVSRRQFEPVMTRLWWEVVEKIIGGYSFRRISPSLCYFCRMPMAEDEIDDCHIKIEGLLTDSWSVKKNIISGHHGCNMLLSEEFMTKITNKPTAAS